MRRIISRTILAAALTATAYSAPAFPADSVIDATAAPITDGSAAVERAAAVEHAAMIENDANHQRGRASHTAAPLRAMLTDLAPWRRAGKLLGLREQRKLNAASARIELQSRFVRNPESDPYYDESRDQVRGSYLKLYREMLREDFLDDWIDDAFAGRGRTPAGTEAAADDTPSWHVRVVPRLALGSHGSVGAKLSLPEVGVEPLDHLSLGVRRGFAGDEWGLSLRYSAGPRFLQLESANGGRDGKRYAATLVFRF
jgi:hypothetical protein